MLEQFVRDVRFGFRTLRKSPGFAISAVLSLALGIGATTALFSVIYGVILNPFVYAHPETLYSFYVAEPDRDYHFYPETPDQYVELAERNHVFSDILGSTISDVFWTGTGKPQRLRGNFVTVNTFGAMGVSPLVGRYITPTDGKTGAEPVAVLGYKFWIEQFGGDPKVLGRHLRLNDRVRTVVGVMPRRFMWRGADVYLPVVLERGKANEGVHYAFLVGRMKPGVTEAQASADLHPIFDDILQAQRGRPAKHFRVELRDFYETFPSGIRRSLWILFGAVGLLLLIACTNVSSLLLARAAARGREMAIRGSLGASRPRILIQLLTESLLLAFTAGILGALLAFGDLRSILSIVPPDTIPAEAEIALNIPVLIFTLAISLGATLIFGLAPALQASRIDFAETLKASGRGISGAFHERRMRNVFVQVEIALTVILLVAASLVIRTLLQLEQIRFATDPNKILTIDLPLPERRYPTIDQRNAFFRQLLDRVRAIPGVQSVELNAFVHPFAYIGSSVKIPGSPVDDKSASVVSQVTPGYVRLLGAKLVAGRNLTDADVDSARHVAVANERFVKLYFANRHALGATIHLVDFGSAPQSLKDDSFQIIGVAADLRNRGLQRETMPEVYIPYTVTGFVASRDATLMATAAYPVEDLVKPIESALAGVDPDQPATSVLTMQALLNRWGFAEPRFSVFLFGIFAGLGLLLAAVGIYAVINYSVVRQTHEIGVRMALGAQRTSVLTMILKAGGRLVLSGGLFGVLTSLVATRILQSMIWGVSPFDPFSFVTVIALVFVVGLIASIVPAVRGSRLDPMNALRYE